MTCRQQLRRLAATSRLVGCRRAMIDTSKDHTTILSRCQTVLAACGTWLVMGLCPVPADATAPEPIVPIEPPGWAVVVPSQAENARWLQALQRPTAETRAAGHPWQAQVDAIAAAAAADLTAQVEAWCGLAEMAPAHPHRAVAQEACGRWLAALAEKTVPVLAGENAYRWFRVRARMAGDEPAVQRRLAAQWLADPALPANWRTWLTGQLRDEPPDWPGAWLAVAGVWEKGDNADQSLHNWLGLHATQDGEPVAAEVRVLSRWCARKVDFACAKIAHVSIVYAEQAFADDDPAEVRTVGYRALDKLCKEGNRLACYSRVRLRRDRQEQPLDAAQAAVELDRLCATRDGLSCSSVGLMRARGDGVALDALAAQADLRRACQYGCVEGCTGVSYYLHQQAGETAALSLAALACRAGEPMGCAHLSNAYATGRGAPLDTRMALLYSVAACRVAKPSSFACRMTLTAAAVGDIRLSPEDVGALDDPQHWPSSGACDSNSRATPSKMCAIQAAYWLARGAQPQQREAHLKILDRVCAEPWQQACQWREHLQRTVAP